MNDTNRREYRQLAGSAETIFTAFYHSPIGRVQVSATDSAILAVAFVPEECANPQEADQLPPLLMQAIEQLDEYFRGVRTEFELPLATAGTVFQEQVWQQVSRIPCGTTVSYKNLAESLGKPNASRAVGTAVGKNRHAVLVPCHRVIGSGKGLHGYAWETWRKQWLLDHEAKKRE